MEAHDSFISNEDPFVCSIFQHLRVAPLILDVYLRAYAGILENCMRQSLMSGIYESSCRFEVKKISKSEEEKHFFFFCSCSFIMDFVW